MPITRANAYNHQEEDMRMATKMSTWEFPPKGANENCHQFPDVIRGDRPGWKEAWEDHHVWQTVHSGTFYTAHCIFYTLHGTLYVPHFTLHTVYSILYTAHCISHHCIVYIAHSRRNTIQYNLFIHTTPYTAQSTLHTIRCTLYAAHYIHFCRSQLFALPHFLISRELLLPPIGTAVIMVATELGQLGGLSASGSVKFVNWIFLSP